MTDISDTATGDLFATMNELPASSAVETSIHEGLTPCESGGGGDDTPPSMATLEMPDGRVSIGAWAERAYLDYAMSVVKGRALPEVADGQKPVQRRILYAMRDMGLTHSSKPVKSARVVGEILGKYHPHGDSSAYEALVRMAQDFSLRYPLIDGHGNFGSRDGDGAAAMRYTEARLTPISELLLSEVNLGTVDFVPNYDGAFDEPRLLPARLPVLLLNGASGIAVGMATDIPSHNLREVADACELLIRNPNASCSDLLEILPGPDFPGGAQIISPAEDIQKIYESGRGSLRVRARWTVEQLARGQWQIVVTELPPGVSTQKVLEEIEDLTNPKIKAGKKALTQEQGNMKALFLSVLDHVRDDSDKDHPVRMILEPRSSRHSPDELMNVLLAHTSLECNNSINLVTIGLDGKPQQKGIAQVLNEWVSFRFHTVTRRTSFRLDEVNKRIHILDGRMIAFLNIDEVIKVIRQSDEPKTELIDAFSLSSLQAEDILEIRLRQLARLEGIKIESELKSLRNEQAHLELLLSSHEAMTTQILSEITADKAKYGDDRRTLIEEAEKITSGAVAPATDDPCTIIVSKAGWLRARTGHNVDLNSLSFKTGDELLVSLETRTSKTLAVFDTNGRCYNVNASQIPTGRGDGSPLTSLVDIQAGGRLSQVIPVEIAQNYLVASTGGYGYVCSGNDLLTRQKAGKAFMSLDDGESMLPLIPVAGEFVYVACNTGRLLVFPLAEVKVLNKGKGVKLMDLEAKESLVAISLGDGKQCSIATSAGKMLELKGAPFEKFHLHRARKGLPLPGKVKPVEFLKGAKDGEA